MVVRRRVGRSGLHPRRDHERADSAPAGTTDAGGRCVGRRRGVATRGARGHRRFVEGDDEHPVGLVRRRRKDLRDLRSQEAVGRDETTGLAVDARSVVPVVTQVRRDERQVRRRRRRPQVGREVSEVDDVLATRRRIDDRVEVDERVVPRRVHVAGLRHQRVVGRPDRRDGDTACPCPLDTTSRSCPRRRADRRWSSRPPDTRSPFRAPARTCPFRWTRTRCTSSSHFGSVALGDWPLISAM